ncbi:lipoyl domain-containing protein [Nocardia flavorosea]|jgi:pyruvate/2-oxoglutarate dehydrogenase complex dihydrolipoamide acyltransferase (E2) component|uniref:Biotin/lipoyl-binding protein n=1 Tax=Nocardia flavorosea TaxID=53429 RepID=A0A846YMX8_9NOCA|nr:lipoyl domain-containing protein [Nocardia flavorosea]NKY60467.1 biotin/lipoyl-binding protein [Nocardia flavorosea]
MISRIKIPKLGMSMQEGTIAEWHVADGDTVEAGQVLYTIETDKVQNEVTSPLGGVITLIAVEGQTYAVGEIVAELKN